MSHRTFLLGLAMLAASPSLRCCDAADYAAIAPYLTADVAAVAVVDLERLDATAIVDQMEQMNLVPEQHLAQAKTDAVAVQAKYAELLKGGARRAYVVFRTSDIGAGGPLWVVEPAEARQAAEILNWLQPVIKQLEKDNELNELLPNALLVDQGVVLGGPSEDRIKALVAQRATEPRAEALEALSSASEADAAAVLFGDADSRRVLRELFPTLPAPFAEIDGKLLADGVKWMAVTVKLPPEGRVTFAIETAGDQSAAALRQSADKALIMLKGLAMAASINPPKDLPISGAQLVQAVDMLTPQVDGARLSITLGDNAEELAILQEFAGKPIQQAREAASRSQRMNNFKQIGLAMFHYESAHKTFPAAASYDANGQPLLSWRVHILPYLEQEELYKEFHLDEPWDSEHNRKLIDRMPEMYADPDSAVRAAIGDRGKTTFVVPVGEGLVFGGKEGQKLRAIKDGTANTLLIVEVVPERAVTWTQPADWEVDMQNPLAGVKRDDRDFFTTAWCDGHGQWTSNAISPVAFRSTLTPAGNEVVDEADIR